jgi:hypothetical protein
MMKLIMYVNASEVFIIISLTFYPLCFVHYIVLSSSKYFVICKFYLHIKVNACDQIHMIAKFKFHSNIIFLLIHDKWKCIYDTDLSINGSFNIPWVVLQLYSRREVWNKNPRMLRRLVILNTCLYDELIYRETLQHYIILKYHWLRLFPCFVWQMEMYLWYWFID